MSVGGVSGGTSGADSAGGGITSGVGSTGGVTVTVGGGEVVPVSPAPPVLLDVPLPP